MKTKTISILGSTGSIGRQTLDVVDGLGIQVAALAAHSGVSRLEEQCRRFRPKLAVLADETAAADLKVRLAGTETKVLGGADALCEAATLPEADTVLSSVVGMAGLKPTLAAIRERKRIALANKETLVCAGELVMTEAARYGAELLPVDSEHSAIFQCLMGVRDRAQVRRLILTASGGPFFGMKTEDLRKVTRVEALRHPNWTMGPKITVDCATLMNKGLEVIEAMRLYSLPLEQVDVVVHRQSVIHSMVELQDGAVMAQLGAPDMRLPIQLALTYPDRLPSPAPALDLLDCGPLTFDPPDEQAFPCLALARRAAKLGGTACAVLNGANEAAVALFLEDRLDFYGISDAVARALDDTPRIAAPSLEQLLEADQTARESVYSNL
ncbi:MAG: 1-deoxy-D-xylulose-5-phosphate reductoisomerase [Oscillospiraceae bacterium]|nr:1-deoxy-D-xylulose-5-phosphate reductoisomerase [Oscillospiraceae bacterium]